MNTEESLEERSMQVFPAGPETRAKAAEWMNARMDGLATFPPELMPETALCCYEYGTLRCVAILYLEKSSKIAVCGWCVTNPKNQVFESERAVRAVMEAMPAFARRSGAKVLLTTFGNRGINRILPELGFLPGDKNVQHFAIKL